MHTTDTVSRSGNGAYLLGHTEAEQRRLDEQADNLRAPTLRLLEGAGLAPGMRVLDVGCGTGDVSLIAAELVGASGSVLGIDRSPEVLETARARALQSGYPSVHFHEGDAETYHAHDPFDAIIGRLVLIHQPRPFEVVRHLAGLLRPDGFVAFVEPVMLPELAWPARPLYSRSIQWCVDALGGAGLVPSTGMRLHTIYREAGLDAPRLQLEGAITAGADRAHATWLADTVRTLLPVMQRLGIANSDEVQIETLADRLVAEAGVSDGMACGMALVCATALATRAGYSGSAGTRCADRTDA